MATQITLVQGEVKEESEFDSQDIEKLLAGFLRALMEEQGSTETRSRPPEHP